MTTKNFRIRQDRGPWFVAGAIGLLLSGCMGDHGGGHSAHMNLPALPPMIRPTPDGEVLSPTLAPDENPDPGVVELNLRASPASLAYLPQQPAPVWAFNGTIPGPLIQANKGDTVIVHFKNDLPEPTTIHWHGVRVPNDMDGAGRLSQPIPAGGTFDYRFTVPDAGLFWYHPHVRSDVQVEKGLYGAILVRDPGESSLGVVVDRVVVLDDVRVDPNTGQTVDELNSRTEMMGREGNLLLVNGRPSNAALTVPAGARVRLHVVNAANARYFSLYLSGAKMAQIGGDGGLLVAPRATTTLVLAPGERADLLIDVNAAATLKSGLYERAMGAGSGEDMDLLRFVLNTDAPAMTAAPDLPTSLRTIDTLPVPSKMQTLTLNESMAHQGWTFTINGRAFPNVPALEATLGSRQLWNVKNDSYMDHPLHVHGFFFQRRDVPEWKDTINIPGRSTVPIIVDFANRPGATGDWMYHCHILEHAEGGMMGEVQIR